jgi:uncharacterized membrane protein (UPF0127 family)
MKQVIVLNNHRPLLSPLKVLYCQSFISKFRGLTFKRSLPSDRGILLVQAKDSRLDSAIHMLGVWIDLGVVWINGQMEVVDTKLARKWRPVYVPQKPARYVLEISPMRTAEFKIGDKLSFENAPRD